MSASAGHIAHLLQLALTRVILQCTHNFAYFGHDTPVY